MLEMVTQRQLMTINIPLIMALLKWVLTNNYFTFNNTTYRQLTGTAMGTPVAPAYANIVLFWIDVKCCENKLPMYMRYLDDIFAITNSEQHARDTVQTFNDQCPTLKLESVTTGPSGIFLDIAAAIQDNKLVTKVYQKPINKYLYLKPTTNHAQIVLKNFLLQEFKRYRLLCTTDKAYNNIARLFIERLQQRAYNIQYITTNILPQIPPRAEILDNIRKKPSKKESGKSTPILIMNQSIKYHLNQNGYSPKRVFALHDQLSDMKEFLIVI